MANLHYLEKCASTNDEIFRFLSLKNENFQAVYTFNQTNGRGQYGNIWKSSENLNLSFTLAIPAKINQLNNHLFNFHTAVLLADFLATMTNSEVKIKWPNDLIIHQKKVSGFLIEKKKFENDNYYIIGIGVNVLQRDFQDLPKAGSLLTQADFTCDLHSFADSLYQYFVNNFEVETSDHEILEKLNYQLFRKDLISVFEINHLRQNGIIKSVDQDGFLWVDMEKDGLKKFYHKEIELLY